MANAKVGVKSGWHSNFVETITEAKTLGTSDSGKLFDVTAGSYAITLPKADADLTGFYCEFVVTTGSTSALTIDSNRAADLYYGGLIAVTGIVASTSNATNGRFYQPDGSDDNTLTIDNDTATFGGDKGTHVKFQCIGANKWLVSGHVMVSAAEDDQTDLAWFS